MYKNEFECGVCHLVKRKVAEALNYTTGDIKRGVVFSLCIECHEMEKRFNKRKEQTEKRNLLVQKYGACEKCGLSLFRASGNRVGQGWHKKMSYSHPDPKKEKLKLCRFCYKNEHVKYTYRLDRDKYNEFLYSSCAMCSKPFFSQTKLERVPTPYPHNKNKIVCPVCSTKDSSSIVLGYIYMMESKKLNMQKIGFSANPQKRVMAIRLHPYKTEDWEVIKEVAILIPPFNPPHQSYIMSFELNSHDYFAPYNIRMAGEYFRIPKKEMCNFEESVGYFLRGKKV